MKMIRSCVALLCFVGPWPALAGEDGPDPSDGHRLVGLLEYVSADYGEAVRDGAVVDDFEYREMGELSEAAAGLARGIGDAQLVASIETLRAAIDARRGHDEIRGHCAAARKRAVEALGLKLTPRAPPDFERGKKTYRTYCAHCHGDDGAANLPEQADLKPQPADFTHPERRAQLSPYRAFNTTTYGVEGTAMASFAHLDAATRWDVAFYVLALAHGAGERPAAAPADAPPLDTLATAKDHELAARFGDVAPLRTGAPFAQKRTPAFETLAVARGHLGAAERAIAEARWDAARTSALAAYLEGFEPLESRLKASEPELTRTVEKGFLDLRGDIKAEDATAATAQLAEIRTHLDAVEASLSGGASFWALVSASAFIALREGVEIVLLLALLLGVVRRMGAEGARRYVHLGWSAAVVAGVLTWFAAQSLVTIPGAGRELLEGVVGLIAAAVLFSVSYWFVGKLQGDRWTRFITAKLESEVSGGRLLSLAGVAFLAVYREAFEVVLFYQALLLEAAGDVSPVLLGIGGATVALAAFAFAIFRLGAKLPLRQFFAVSAVGLYALCVILAGNGLHALVEAGVYEPVAVPAPSVPLLGLYPDLVSVALQALLLMAALVWFIRTRGPTAAHA